MTGKRPVQRERLLNEMEQARVALTTTLARLTPDQMTAVADDAGSTVKDHLVHLAAWE